MGQPVMHITHVCLQLWDVICGLIFPYDYCTPELGTVHANTVTFLYADACRFVEIYVLVFDTY